MKEENTRSILKKWLTEEVNIKDKKLLDILMRNIGKVIDTSEIAEKELKILFKKIAQEKDIPEPMKLKLFRTLLITKLIDTLNIAPQSEQSQLLEKTRILLNLPIPRHKASDNDIYA